MPDEYWFKRRRHGYGWTPVTRQGWIAVAGMLVVVLGGAAVLALTQPESTVGVIVYLAVVAITLVAFVALTLRKGPPPRWRWGRSPDDDPDADL